jgi:conjugal transfer pilus assembly protein TraF
MSRYILLILLSCSVGFSEHVSQGWAWYNQADYIDYNKLNDKYNKEVKSTKKTALEKLKEFQKLYENVHAEAVLNPTPTTAAKDLQLRKFMYDKSIDYANASQKALLLHPELSNTLSYPTQQASRVAYYHQQKQQEQLAVEKIAQKYGLFFFYKGSDALANQQATSLQAFADKNHISLIGVSLDGKYIPSIKNNKVNKGQAEAFKVKGYPAIFIANPTKKRVYPVAYGFIAMDELAQRIYQIATDYGRVKL